MFNSLVMVFTLFRRYMSDTGKTIESTKAQEQNQVLEKQIAVYKRRLREVAELLQKSDLDKILSKLKIRDLLELPVENSVVLENGNSKLGELIIYLSEIISLSVGILQLERSEIFLNDFVSQTREIVPR